MSIQSAKKVDDYELAGLMEDFEALCDRALETKKNGPARALADQARKVVCTLQRECTRLNFDLKTLRDQMRPGTSE